MDSRVLCNEMRKAMTTIHRLCTDTLQMSPDPDPSIAMKQYQDILQLVAKMTVPYQKS